MKKLFLLTIIIMLAVAVCGCDLLKKEKPDETTVITTSEEPEPMPFPVTVNGTDIEESPSAVISLTPALTEIIYEMGYGERLVGRDSYADFPEESLDKPDVGSATNPNIDAIVALSPKLLLSSTAITAKDIFELTKNGINTVVLPAPTNVEQFRAIYRALGFVFEGAFTGEEVGDAAFAAISHSLDNTDVVNLGKFIYITENMSIATGDTLESAVLSCFGTNLAVDAENYEYDKTQLTENQPDFILLNNIYSLEDLELDEVYSGLDAVANGRIIYIDNRCFERPSVRISETLKKLSEDYFTLQRN